MRAGVEKNQWAMVVNINPSQRKKSKINSLQSISRVRTFRDLKRTWRECKTWFQAVLIEASTPFGDHPPTTSRLWRGEESPFLLGR
ncbi:MAG: hypothetical protein KME57_24175 [Scytonema hyalinum WJT4-NPBG1]|nr:hypothetical protein [Scytonema hyalinum WJT4-NPBG1]